eukprot:70058-Amphidinium_carterae.2
MVAQRRINDMRDALPGTCRYATLGCGAGVTIRCAVRALLPSQILHQSYSYSFEFVGIPFVIISAQNHGLRVHAAAQAALPL